MERTPSVIPNPVSALAIEEPMMALEQKLAAFDPALHGGEAMMHGSVGKEILLWRELRDSQPDIAIGS